MLSLFKDNNRRQICCCGVFAMELSLNIFFTIVFTNDKTEDNFINVF